MNWTRLRDFTPARVALGRAGNALPTRELLQLRLSHARARDAVFAELDARRLAMELQPTVGECLLARSAAQDRETYIRQPDSGRRLSDGSRQLLATRRGHFDTGFIIADGLSSLAVERHARPMLERILSLLDARSWTRAPVLIVEQGRVAIGDDVAECLGLCMSVVLIGERPGLSSPDSLGMYLTWNPGRESTNANRNCISNIRTEGLSYDAAAGLLLLLMNESRARKLSGVALRIDQNRSLVEKRKAPNLHLLSVADSTTLKR
jgi:ethanolamine ammonia-lyase small subunit